jgi:Asp/Glu/hydantoin racemase
VVGVGRHLMARDKAVKALLLECSLLPPYAAALQAAVQVPVFDYITMINFVFSALVKRPYDGFL